MRHFTNYNIPNVCKLWFMYDYKVPAASMSPSAGVILYYIGHSQPCNTMNDMFTGVGNPAVSGWPTASSLYSNYAPYKFINKHTYQNQVNPAVVANPAAGQYILVMGYDDSATNPFTAFASGGVVNSQFILQQLRGYMQVYHGKMKIIRRYTDQTEKPFVISSSITVPELLGRQSVDIWDTTYSAAVAANPTSAVYCHSCLFYLRSTDPGPTWAIEPEVCVKVLFNQPQNNYDDE